MEIWNIVFILTYEVSKNAILFNDHHKIKSITVYYICDQICKQGLYTHLIYIHVTVIYIRDACIMHLMFDVSSTCT